MPHMPYPRNIPPQPFKPTPKPNTFDPTKSAEIENAGRNFTHDISATGAFAAYLKCPRCFWLQRRVGWNTPSTPPFMLNKRLDQLMRQTFDNLRFAATPTAYPPLAAAGYDAPPWHDPAECQRVAGDPEFREKVLGIWPSPKSQKPTGWRGARLVGNVYGPNGEFNVYGEMDEICIMPNGKLLIVDFKGKYSEDQKLTDLSLGYNVWLKVQMDFYGWLLEKKGFDVHDECIILQMNANTSQTEMMDGKMEFRPLIVPHTLNTSWIEPVLDEMLNVLKGTSAPPPGRLPTPTKKDPGATVECDYCVYRAHVPA